MKWRKLGLVFDLSRHALPEGYIGFAQAPQPLVTATFVRVFFSARRVDPEKQKFISEVLFVDFAPDFSEVLQVAREPVISRGQLGCFDEHGIFPMSVLKQDAELWGYTCGWSRRISVSVETGIGLAVSRDGGLTFQRRGNGPVLTSSPQEPFLVGDGFVLKTGGTYHMWYIFGTQWRPYPTSQELERTYKIGHAVSRDGMSWEKSSEGVAIIPDALGENESQALPGVIQIDGQYHMFFCFRYSHDFRRNPRRGYRLGHAVSQDLDKWVRQDADVALPGELPAWDSEMMCYPGVCRSEGRIYLLYNGNEFGRHGFGAALLET